MFIIGQVSVPFESQQPAHSRRCARRFYKHVNVTLHKLLW